MQTTRKQRWRLFTVGLAACTTYKSLASGSIAKCVGRPRLLNKVSHTFEFAWHRCTRLSPVSAMISFPSISKTKHLGTDYSEGEFTFPSANINVIVNINILATITTNRRKPVIGGLQRNILASIDIHVTTSTSRPLRDSMLHLQTQVEHGVSVRPREMPPTILVHEADKLGKLKQ